MTAETKGTPVAPKSSVLGEAAGVLAVDAAAKPDLHLVLVGTENLPSGDTVKSFRHDPADPIRRADDAERATWSQIV